MSKIKDFVIDIQSDIEDGELTFEQIARNRGVSLEAVQDIARNMDEYYEYLSTIYQMTDVGCEFDPKVQ